MQWFWEVAYFLSTIYLRHINQGVRVDSHYQTWVENPAGVCQAANLWPIWATTDAGAKSECCFDPTLINVLIHSGWLPLPSTLPLEVCYGRSCGSAAFGGGEWFDSLLLSANDNFLLWRCLALLFTAALSLFWWSRAWWRWSATRAARLCPPSCRPPCPPSCWPPCPPGGGDLQQGRLDLVHLHVGHRVQLRVGHLVHLVKVICNKGG